MMWFISAIAFLVLLTLLVIAHELGHYGAALLTKVRVEEFGFGLPPRARSLFQYRKTLFSLNWIPFGGFVRLQGENSMDPEERHKEGSFAAASIPARLAILLAGVTMNLLIALILFTFGFWLWNWVPTYLTAEDLQSAEARGEIQVEWALGVVAVSEGSPAAAAGVESGEILTAIDGQEVVTFEDVLSAQEGKAAVTYTLLSSNDALATTREEFVERSVSISLRDGKTGVEISSFALDLRSSDRSFADGVILALRETSTVTIGTVQGVGRLLGSLVFDQRVPSDIAGIVGIAQLTHSSIQQGLMKYLRLVALLSLSLAVLNVLPFPALDGGRVFFVLYELVFRHPVNRRFEVVTNGVGIALIMAIMLVVTWNDVLRIIASGS
jgi:regulator of sigma E protease